MLDILGTLTLGYVIYRIIFGVVVNARDVPKTNLPKNYDEAKRRLNSYYQNGGKGPF